MNLTQKTFDTRVFILHRNKGMKTFRVCDSHCLLETFFPHVISSVIFRYCAEGKTHFFKKHGLRLYFICSFVVRCRTTRAAFLFILSSYHNMISFRKLCISSILNYLLFSFLLMKCSFIIILFIIREWLNQIWN